MRSDKQITAWSDQFDGDERFFVIHTVFGCSVKREVRPETELKELQNFGLSEAISPLIIFASYEWFDGLDCQDLAASGDGAAAESGPPNE
ncbi:unnamed protein product [Dibothriocephalus latus]|uniref:Uncharacterized protein n=1 Tax=Dibothriocephalus latus TaxID=60516 RepID=A0A3P7M486_DIBLA|nr:unnamed protein product [Dibothriocephalus latus]